MVIKLEELKKKWAAEDDHRKQIVVSWCDDGVLLECHRNECMIGKYYYQYEVDGFPYPEDLVNFRNMHVLGKLL